METLLHRERILAEPEPEYDPWIAENETQVFSQVAAINIGVRRNVQPLLNMEADPSEIVMDICQCLVSDSHGCFTWPKRRRLWIVQKNTPYKDRKYVAPFSNGKPMNKILHKGAVVKGEPRGDQYELECGELIPLSHLTPIPDL